MNEDPARPADIDSPPATATGSHVRNAPSPNNGPIYFGLPLLFIASYCLYSWIFHYVIVLHRLTPSLGFFVFSRGFLTEFLDLPGGLTHYAGRFFGQFLHDDRLGALVVSLSITGFGFLLHLVLRRLKKGGIFHTLFPCSLLLATHSGVTYGSTIGLVVTCGAFLVYLVLPGVMSRRAYAWIVTPLLYFVTGGYFWLFAGWIVLSEWIESPLSSNLASKLLYPLLAVAIPLAAYRWIYLLPFDSALLHPIDRTISATTQPCIAVALAIYLLLMPLWARISWGRRLESFWSGRAGSAVQTALVVVAAASLLSVSYDRTVPAFTEYHELYEKMQWDAILDKVKGKPSKEVMTQFFTNYALCRKGLLLDEMFRYPQPQGALGLVLHFSPNKFFNFVEEDIYRAMYLSDLFFALGDMNTAFRHAYNHMGDLGLTYENLKRMAECNLVNGNYALAGKYLNILERTLFYGGFARRHKGLLADAHAADEHFAAARARLPSIELEMYLGSFVPLINLIESDPTNRMALDYLAAWCLLDRASLPILAAYIDSFKEVGYDTLPTHCQEALLVLEKSLGRPVDRCGFTYDAHIVTRFETFAGRMAGYPSKESAELELESDFGDTYMYYYIFARADNRLNHVPSHFRLAKEFHAVGKHEDAILHYQQALHLKPMFPEARIGLGDVLMLQGKLEEAGVQYRQAIMMNPDAVEVREKLERIRRMSSEEGG